MEVPVIDLIGLHGSSAQERRETMDSLHEACQNWGCFQAINHGVDDNLIHKFKRAVNLHYDQKMKPEFYESEVAKVVSSEAKSSDVDWESSFFVRHMPCSNIDDFTDLTDDFRTTIHEYVQQVTQLAEKLLEAMSENLGLESLFLKQQFAGGGSPSIGTKVAKYPECPRPELVKGLREHTDAGGIIFLLQDDQVPGLQFFKDGQWVDILPTPTARGKSTVFINTGDQLEVISNGRYKSALHRVLATRAGSRLSIVTFYNPAADALISPASELLYPRHFRFQDYLNLYATTKFSDKVPRFQEMKKMLATGNVATATT